MSDEDNAWPIRWLKMLAHLAHEQEVFVGAGGTYVGANRSLAGNTRLAGVLTAPSVLHPKSARLTIHDDVSVAFLALWPVYSEELALAQQVGGLALFDRLHGAGVTDLVDIRRKNAVLEGP